MMNFSNVQWMLKLKCGWPLSRSTHRLKALWSSFILEIAGDEILHLPSVSTLWCRIWTLKTQFQSAGSTSIHKDLNCQLITSHVTVPNQLYKRIKLHQPSLCPPLNSATYAFCYCYVVSNFIQECIDYPRQCAQISF